MDGSREPVTVPAGDFPQAIKVLHNFNLTVTITLPAGGTGRQHAASDRLEPGVDDGGPHGAGKPGGQRQHVSFYGEICRATDAAGAGRCADGRDAWHTCVGRR